MNSRSRSKSHFQVVLRHPKGLRSRSMLHRPYSRQSWLGAESQEVDYLRKVLRSISTSLLQLNRYFNYRNFMSTLRLRKFTVKEGLMRLLRKYERMKSQRTPSLMWIRVDRFSFDCKPWNGLNFDYVLWVRIQSTLIQTKTKCLSSF